MNAHMLAGDGTIINTIVVEDRVEIVTDADGNESQIVTPALQTLPGMMLVDASIGGSIGDKIVNGVVIPATPQPEPLIVPDKVDRLQARLALIYAGKWSLIQPAIDAISDPIQHAVAQAYFEDAKRWYRQDPFVLTLGPAIGLSDADMDALFIDAAGR